VLEQQESRITLWARDWLPWFAGALVGLIGFVFVFFSARAEKRAEASQSVAQLSAEFTSLCQQPCVVNGTLTPGCVDICACTLNTLRSQHPGDAAFASWFSEARAAKPHTEQEIKTAHSSCIAEYKLAHPRP
jgi:hypothetical protein